MKPKGLYLCLLILCCFLFNACAISTKAAIEKKNKKYIEYNAILTDPIIKKDFRALRSIAMNATIYENDTLPHFDNETIAKLNQATAVLIDKLQNNYHLTPDKYKIHTYIGSNEAESCYQYYQSNDTSLTGKSCEDFSSLFSSCSPCNNYVGIVKSRTMKVIHASWLSNKETTALIDTFKLRNGDFVFMGLDLSPVD